MTLANYRLGRATNPYGYSELDYASQVVLDFLLRHAAQVR